jgi:ABC-type lipoprotein export system ATPase subunit
MTVAVLNDVWKSYSGREFVLKEINLKLEEGDSVIIKGRSGAGKTTLLRIIGLLEKTSKGSVVVFGREASGLNDVEAAAIRLNDIGFIFQDLNLIPHLTILENIELPMYVKGIPADERRARGLDLLKRFDLAWLAERYPDEASQGEKQRVAAIRALVNRPRLILADEPAVHLDEENAELLFDLFRSFNEDKASVVMTSTGDENAELAKTTYLLNAGVLREA